METTGGHCWLLGSLGSLPDLPLTATSLRASPPTLCPGMSAETGTIAGVASALAMALIGAVSSYISYQQKKFCFSIQRKWTHLRPCPPTAGDEQRARALEEERAAL